MPGQPLCSALASYCKPFRNLTDHLNWQGQGRREGSRRVGPEDHQMVLGKDDRILNYSYTMKV